MSLDLRESHGIKVVVLEGFEIPSIPKHDAILSITNDNRSDITNRRVSGDSLPLDPGNIIRQADCRAVDFMLSSLPCFA